MQYYVLFIVFTLNLFSLCAQAVGDIIGHDIPEAVVRADGLIPMHPDGWDMHGCMW